jgi:hypothetical protein
MPADEVEAKAADLVAPLLGDAGAAALIAATRRIETLPARALRDLLRIETGSETTHG